MMEQHLSIKGQIRHITLYKVGRYVVEIIILLQTELGGGPDGIMKLPPNNVAVGILWTVHIRVAIWCDLIRIGRCI